MVPCQRAVPLGRRSEADSRVLRSGFMRSATYNLYVYVKNGLYVSETRRATSLRRAASE